MKDPYPPIEDYGLIGDCHSCALVSRVASIDWCCLPRFDSGTTFGRLLDWERGGYCSVQPADGDWEAFQDYEEDALVLVTTFRGETGEARVVDCFAMREGGAEEPRRELLRIVECVRGSVELRVVVEPRFDYGDVRPLVSRIGVGAHSATGGDDGLVLLSDMELEATRDADGLEGGATVHAGERRRLAITFVRPELIERREHPEPGPEELDEHLEETRAWWRRWASQTRAPGADHAAVGRSAMVLKALTYAPTGAVVAASTTSLPESKDGGRTWDYRYSWIRDSVFGSRSLAEVGHEVTADRFRRFICRTAAGRADDLRVMYGVGGERRLDEHELDTLEGYRGAGPVRVGNGAATQTQLDVLGEILNLYWRWHRRGHSPDDDDWRFIADLADMAIDRWQEKDSGIWEVRAPLRHFVHSKAMCWSAVNCALALAEECMRAAPSARWRRARDEIRAAIDEQGYDEDRGVYVQAFGMKAMDAALLRLPTFDFIDYDDPRMIRTTDAVRDELSDNGLLRRYRTSDGQPGEEGAFLACSFWLVECLAKQGRVDEARASYDRTVATANHLGLFSEEYDAGAGAMLGNFPQGLTHLSHIVAALALAEASG